MTLAMGGGSSKTKGLVLILVGILLNPWLLEHFVSPDQHLDHPIKGVMIVFVDLVFLFAGIHLLFLPSSFGKTVSRISRLVSNINIWLVVAIFLAMTVYLISYTGNSSIDDAYIFYRYADNLASGDGLVYNPGGARVEGFSSFTWTMVLAGASLLRLPLDITSRLLGIIFGVCSILLTYKITKHLLKESYPGSLAALVIALNPAFVIWVSTSGMDNALFITLILATTYCLVKGLDKVSYILAALVAITRPEGLVMLLFAIPYSIIVRKINIRRVAGLIGLYAALFLPFIIFRLLYFGYPLPNTFYAKVSILNPTTFVLGWMYIYRFMRVHILFVIPIIIGCIFVRRRKPLLIAGLAALLLVTTIFSGGDHFTLFRRAINALPLIAILSVYYLIRILQRIGVKHIPILAVGAVLLAVGYTATPLALAASQSRIDHIIVEEGKFIGEYVRENTPNYDIIAVGCSGALPYFADREVVDVLGLNDKEIAHAEKDKLFSIYTNHGAFNEDIFYKRQPDYFFPCERLINEEDGCHTNHVMELVYRNITTTDKFKDAYEEFQIELKNGSIACGFRRRDL